MSDTQTQMSPAVDDPSGERKVPFLRAPVFWQNVLAGIVASVIMLIGGLIFSWIYTVAIGDIAPTIVKALLALATGGSAVIATVAVVQLFRSEEKYKWLIVGFLWLIVAILALVTGIAFANR